MTLFEIIGAIIGLAYIVSEYRADRWFWPLSLLMSAFYIVIDFTSGIYANGAICCYNFVMSVYGILVWRGVVQKKGAKDGERPITSCPPRYWWQIVLLTGVLSVAFWFLLSQLPDESSYPVLDGISSALTIVAMMMLTQKWWQQWICWMIVEPVMISIFWLTGNYASAVLYVVFEVFCVLGVIRWRKEALGQTNNQAVKP
ncbi:MAG: nicotinamide mononucleotide transporter [bacterium P3]|nr:MAG: nicotinamide mononucleotide transporter [bacterium P3]KWW40022.1 MAG: nicotinamide mononucleotide transporter [bacterium F083]